MLIPVRELSSVSLTILLILLLLGSETDEWKIADVIFLPEAM
jgi:hypothetical protein